MTVQSASGEDRSILWLHKVSKGRQPHTEICPKRASAHHLKPQAIRDLGTAASATCTFLCWTSAVFVSQITAVLSQLSVNKVIPPARPTRLHGLWTHRHLQFWSSVMLPFLKWLTQMWFSLKIFEVPRFHSVSRVALKNIWKVRKH